jgi:hypothetical protein
VSAVDIAAARQRRMVALARRAAAELGRLWAGVDRAAIAPSWSAAVERAAAILESAQSIAAAGAGPYLDALTAEYNVSGDAAGAVRPIGFAGVASDGRDLRSLLRQPAITALTSIGAGDSPARAMASGRFALDMIVRTQVADAVRTADGVALTARPQLPGYVRMLSLPSCSRCVLLAGRRYRWNAGFNRHPRCDCTSIPARENVAGDIRTDPKAYFRSLTPAEQDRTFTAAGAQAIRDGADIGQVVNARRGMYTAGTVKATHANAGRRIRLMPEQIYKEAGNDRAEAVRLLKLHGYLF